MVPLIERIQALRGLDGVRAFPVALDPFTCTRFEMARFAAAARELGVDYVGICCGAGPHHVRAMAEALGRDVPASRYSPSMELHPMFRAEVGQGCGLPGQLDRVKIFWGRTERGARCRRPWRCGLP